MGFPPSTGEGTSGTLRVQGSEPKTRRCLWRSGRGIQRFQRQYEAVVKLLSDAFCVFVATFYCDIDPSIANAKACL